MSNKTDKGKPRRKKAPNKETSKPRKRQPRQPPKIARPETGRKPGVFAVGDQKWQVTTWRDILIQAIHYLHETHPAEHGTIFTDPKFEGRKRRLFTTEPGTLRSPSEVPGGYVEVNLGSIGIVGLVEKMLEHCGVSAATVGIEYRT